MKKQKEEKKFLKELIKQGYEYIARDRYGRLVVFKNEPSKEINFYYSKGMQKEIDGALLPEITFKSGVLKNAEILKNGCSI